MICPNRARSRSSATAENFCAVEDAELQGFSAAGPGCLKTLALRLLSSGQPPDMPVVLFRGGERAGKTTLANTAFYSE